MLRTGRAERRRQAFQMQETAEAKEERQESTKLSFCGGQARNRLIGLVDIRA